jgi:hypothetical protein
MASQFQLKSLSSSRIRLETLTPPLWNTRVLLFLVFFLANELSIAVEAKPGAKMNAFKNVTVVNKAGRYLTIGKQGISGESSYSPYGKNYSGIYCFRTCKFVSIATFKMFNF